MNYAIVLGAGISFGIGITKLIQGTEGPWVFLAILGLAGVAIATITREDSYKGYFKTQKNPRTSKGTWVSSRVK